MSEHDVNPVKYFNENVFTESLLLSYEYVNESLTIVLEYAHRNASMPSPKGMNTVREFRRLKFSNVYDYKREPGLNKAFQRSDVFYAENSKGMHVIQGLKIRRESENHRIDVWFDHSFGGIGFSFSLLFVDCRLGVAQRNAQGEFDYYDENTKQRFNFYKPFEL
jgi:hypothetical protein